MNVHKRFVAAAKEPPLDWLKGGVMLGMRKEKKRKRTGPQKLDLSKKRTPLRDKMIQFVEGPYWTLFMIILIISEISVSGPFHIS